MLNQEFLQKLEKFVKLVDEAHRYYFDNINEGHKSSEGHISVGLGTFFDRQDNPDYEPPIELYAYAIGEHRSHFFDNIDQAIDVVEEWFEGLKKWAEDISEGYPYEYSPYAKIEAERMEANERAMSELDELFGFVD